MTPALIADSGGLLRAVTVDRRGRQEWPAFARELSTTVAVIVPALVLAEVDYFLREDRRAMRRLIAEIFDPNMRYQFEATSPADVVRAMQLDSVLYEAPWYYARSLQAQGKLGTVDRRSKLLRPVQFVRL